VTSPGLLRVHRYVALSLGVIVVALGLTGASLVFRDELTAWFTPAVAIAPGPIAPGQYQRLWSAARRAEPAASWVEIVPPPTADRAVEIILVGARGERHLFVDPRDGAVVADSDREWLPFATLYQVHRRFLIGETGEYVVAAGGAALAFLAVTGLVMWWPRKWKHAFRIRWPANRVALSFDLHRSLGAAFALFLAFNAVTGLAMVFDGAASTLVNRVSGSPDVGPPPAVATSTFAGMKPLDEIVAAAERAMPGGAVTRIVLRSGKAALVRKRFASDNETHGMNRIYVDGASGTVLRASALERLPPGSAMFEWLYPMHTGKLFGTPYKALLILAGIAPMLSLVTGLILWRRPSRPPSKKA